MFSHFRACLLEVLVNLLKFTNRIKFIAGFLFFFLFCFNSIQSSSLRPAKLNQSFSAEYSPEVSEAIQVQPSKQSKPRWSSLLGLKTPQQNQVCDILNDFSKNGVPQKATNHFFDIPNLSPALHYLNNMPSSWKDFIAHEKMTNIDIKVQSAIWELVTTEADYILVLQTIVEVSDDYYYYYWYALI